MKKRTAKRDGCGQPISDEAMYYIQDARQIVGNCALWWCHEGAGYTTELDEAGKFSGAFARSLRDTDVPWPVRVVESAAVRHVRTDRLRAQAG